MTEAASITPTTTHEEILSRLPPNIRHMAARDPFVSAGLPVFLRAVKEILTEGNNDEESSH